jgi:hypothetical protein
VKFGCRIRSIHFGLGFEEEQAMNRRNVRHRIVDRIAVTAMFAVSVLILTIVRATANVEVNPFSATVPLAVAPAVCPPDVGTGNEAPNMSATGWRS